MIRGEFWVALAFWVAIGAAAAPCDARDLSLMEAEKLLAAHNRELRAARRAVESAQAQRLIAAARPNPTFSINSSQINNNPGIGAGPLGQKHIDTVFRIDQPFERGDKRELRLDAASGLQKAAENDSLDVLRQQLAALRAAYFDLKQVQEKALVLADTAQLFTGTLAAAQARLKARDLAPADVAKVQVDYERAQNEARGVRAELVRAQFALGYMIGAEAGAGELRATDPWPAAERADPAALEQAIDARPDVLAAQARVEAAEKQRDLAKAQRTRDFTIGAQFERFPGSLPINSIGFGVAFPLFTGYDFSGDIQKAEVDRYAALDALERARALAGIELRRAASDLNAAAERLERYETSPPRVDKNAVIFEPASPQLGSIRTASAEPQREAVLRFNGRLVWDEDRTARVYTPFAGKVLSIAARPGDKVKAGRVLAVLSAPELGSAQAEARKAEQDFLLAQKNRARIEELHAAGVAPAKDLQAAQAEEARAASERARTQAKLRAYGGAADSVNQAFVLRSPLSGVVVERQLNPGQELRPDAAPPTGLFVISDPSQLWFVLDVSDKDLGAVRPGVQVNLSTAALGDERVAGRITHVADVVDPQTRTIKVRGTVANAERRLKAEMFVTGDIKVPAGIGLLVPGKAV